MMHWRALFIVSLCLGCLAGSGPASAAEVSGTLATDTSDLFGRFRYGVYQFDVDEPGPLKVGLRSKAFDAYLMLVSPKGEVFTNDDAPQSASERLAGVSGRNDAGWTVPKALVGRWLLVATTSSAGEGGAYQLAVDGAERLSLLKNLPEEASTKVRAAFLERGVEDVQSRRQALMEQLTLPSFRASLRRRIGNELRRLEEPEREQRLRKELAETQSELAQLTAFINEIPQLPQSAEIVRKLLKREIESKTASEERHKDELLKLVTDRSGYSVALDKLRALEEASQTLQKQAEAAGAELSRLRREEEALRGDMADKLMSSRIVSELDHRLTGVRLMAGVDDRGMLLGSMHSLTMGLTAPSPAYALKRFQSFGSALGRYRDSTSTLSDDAPPDASVWLPALLPWPPPASSSQWVIHRSDLDTRKRKLDTLGNLDDVLRGALTDVGYPSPRYWGGVPHGFAVVTPLEQIAADGTPLSPKWRWRKTVAEMTLFSLSEYLKALVTAPAGFFRVLVFIVSSRPFATRDYAEKLDIIQCWASAGLNALPATVRTQPYTDAHLTTVLIYEFEKRDGRAPPVATTPGRLSALDHLRGTKLATTLGLTTRCCGSGQF